MIQTLIRMNHSRERRQVAKPCNLRKRDQKDHTQTSEVLARHGSWRMASLPQDVVRQCLKSLLRSHREYCTLWYKVRPCLNLPDMVYMRLRTHIGTIDLHKQKRRWGRDEFDLPAELLSKLYSLIPSLTLHALRDFTAHPLDIFEIIRMAVPPRHVANIILAYLQPRPQW